MEKYCIGLEHMTCIFAFRCDVDENHVENVSGTFGDQRRFGRRTNAIVQRKTVNPEIMIY